LACLALNHFYHISLQQHLLTRWKFWNPRKELQARQISSGAILLNFQSRKKNWEVRPCGTRAAYPRSTDTCCCHYCWLSNNPGKLWIGSRMHPAMMRNPVTKRRRRFHPDLPPRSHAEWSAAPLQRPPPYVPLRYPSQTPPLARPCQPSLPLSTHPQSVVVAKRAAVEEAAAEREASASASFLPISQSSSAEASCPQPRTPSHPPAPKTLIKVCKTSYNREMVQTIPGPRTSPEWSHCHGIAVIQFVKSTFGEGIPRFCWKFCCKPRKRR
jgi:hypothetical protein